MRLQKSPIDVGESDLGIVLPEKHARPDLLNGFGYAHTNWVTASDTAMGFLFYTTLIRKVRGNAGDTERPAYLYFDDDEGVCHKPLNNGWEYTVTFSAYQMATAAHPVNSTGTATFVLDGVVPATYTAPLVGIWDHTATLKAVCKDDFRFAMLVNEATSTSSSIITSMLIKRSPLR